MKHTRRTSGKARAALSKPQPNTPVKMEPTREQIEEQMIKLICGGMEQFAIDPSIARAFYTKHRKLVASPKFPPLYADRYKRSTGEDIGRAVSTEAPTEASLRKKWAVHARSIATMVANETH